MSDYEPNTSPFAIALDELIKRFLGEGVPQDEIAAALEEIAATLEEAALQAGDEELGEDDEWRKKR
jgi:hypothetical protein